MQAGDTGSKNSDPVTHLHKFAEDSFHQGNPHIGDIKTGGLNKDEGLPSYDGEQLGPRTQP